MKKHHYTKSIIFLVFLLFTNSILSAKEMFADLISEDEDFTLLFPKRMMLKGFVYMCNTEVSGPIEMIVANNPGTSSFEISVSSPITSSLLSFNRSLDVIRTETLFPSTIQLLMKKTGHDKRIYYKDNTSKDVDVITLEYYMGGKEKKRKKISGDRDTFPSDSVLLMYQALLLKEIKKDFLFDLISLDDALKVRMSVTYDFTDNVLSLSKEFHFPEGIEKAIDPKVTYHVFKMRIHGLLGLFIRSSWYCVFKASYPYEFVAYWGGDGSGAETIYMLETETIE